ncbi:MAG: hypothetical protein WCR72_04895 [Bacteroidota bacterium]
MGADSSQPTFLNLLFGRLAGWHISPGFQNASRMAGDACWSFTDVNLDFTGAYLVCADAYLNLADANLNCADAYLNLKGAYLNVAGTSQNISEGNPAVENPIYGEDSER